MAEIATVGPAPKPLPLGGRQRVRIMRACRISIGGHQEEKLAVGAERELPAHIWPSLVEAGAAVLLSDEGAPPVPTAAPGANGRTAEATAPPPAAEDEAELPEAKRKSRLVRREG